MSEGLTVAGIGELLWDVFPNRKRLGGAPANFAYHAHQLGAQAFPVSCVGADPLGHDIRKQLQEMGVDSRYIMEAVDFPTGTVDVVLNAGKPTYKIHEEVAWDRIPFTNELEALAGRLNAVCFGSLSQRSAKSRETIHAFLGHTQKVCLKIFDVNLRQSFFSKQQIETSLDLANVLKLSDEELPVLADFFGFEGDSAEQINALRKRFHLRLVAYTRGANGSVLAGVDETNDFSGCKGVAVDSVGAGDSFTASLCMGLLRGWPLSRVNEFANQVATFVCSQDGATPVLPRRLADRAFKKESAKLS